MNPQKPGPSGQGNNSTSSNSSKRPNRTTGRGRYGPRNYAQGRGHVPSDNQSRINSQNKPAESSINPTTKLEYCQPTTSHQANLKQQRELEIAENGEPGASFVESQNTFDDRGNQDVTHSRYRDSNSRPRFYKNTANRYSQRYNQRQDRNNYQARPSTSRLDPNDGEQNKPNLMQKSEPNPVPNQGNRNQFIPRRFINNRNSVPLRNGMSQRNKYEENADKFSECMICYDKIFRAQPIWYCTRCYNIFHFKCAKEWYSKSNVDGDSYRLSPTTGLWTPYNLGPEHIWACPACRKVICGKPEDYKCFCGKVIRPEINHHLEPHSCGQICGRKRSDAQCPHLCNQICHPGRCKACQLTSKKSCYCGKLRVEIKCTTTAGSCEQICGKVLGCGRHRCPRICHEDTCGECEEILVLKCYCGSETISTPCVDYKNVRKQKMGGKFFCGKVCGKLLDCGKHRCLERCHPRCKSCILLSQNITKCPCGATTLKSSDLASRKSCTDPIPTCENKCNALLKCGPVKKRHRCQQKCHTGSCPPCELKSTIKCECSVTSDTIDCSLKFKKILDEQGQVTGFEQLDYTFKCETRCNRLKNCAKHRCQEKCCDAKWNPSSQAHKCQLICNKKLSCGVHKCKLTCHTGPCGECPNVGWSELTCHCGSSIVYPPIPCGTRPPTCNRPCQRTQNCTHPVNHECHNDTERCPPCTIFVKKSCFCGSESKGSVYCYLPGYSCGRTCKKLLSCRQHTCKRICHDGNCESPNERGVILCSQLCPMPRYLCKHPCNLPCHGKNPCPTTNCSKAIEIKCACGNKSERVDCHKLTRDSENINKIAMLRSNQDSVVVDISSAAKSTTDTVGNPTKILDCDESCALYKRNKALAEALDIDQPNLKPTCSGEDPLKLIREATVQDYKFVASTYNSLAKLVKSAQESERRFSFLQFPPASKLRREVIHELAHHFNCTSESRDEEPERYVSVRANRNKSRTPEFTIEQLLPVDE